MNGTKSHDSAARSASATSNDASRRHSFGNLPLHGPWRIQFTLRSMFVVVSLVAVCLALAAQFGLFGVILFLIGATMYLVISGVRLRRTSRLVESALVAIAVLAIAPAVPPTIFINYARHQCGNCGLVRVANTAGEYRLGKRVETDRQCTYHENGVRAWYCSHFGESCRHNWVPTGVSTTGYVGVFGMRWWAVSGACGCGHETSELPQSVLAQLNDLHKIDLDACRQSLANVLAGRSPAGSMLSFPSQ